MINNVPWIVFLSFRSVAPIPITTNQPTNNTTNSVTLDLKGHQFAGHIYPGPTVMVVTLNKAGMLKVDGMTDEFVQMIPKRKRGLDAIVTGDADGRYYRNMDPVDSDSDDHRRDHNNKRKRKKKNDDDDEEEDDDDHKGDRDGKQQAHGKRPPATSIKTPKKTKTGSNNNRGSKNNNSTRKRKKSSTSKRKR
jgi:hypothetical protein